MANNSGKETSSTVSDEDEGILKQFSEFHICLSELQESNRRILNRLDNLLQTQEEDRKIRFQEEHRNAISELENQISLMESHDRRREKQLEELQQSLKIVMEKSDHCYGMIFPEGDLEAAVPSVEKSVEINVAGISDTGPGAFQWQSDMVAVGRNSIQHEISFVTPEHCSSTMEGFMEVEDSKSHTASSTNLLSRQETERLVVEGSVSRDGSELRVVKPPGAEFSELDVPGSEPAGQNVIKGHHLSLRDSEETYVDPHVLHISGPEMERQEITENMSSSESSNIDFLIDSSIIDVSIDNQIQGNRAVKQEGDIISVCHGVDYNQESVQRKDVEQRDPTQKKSQPPGIAYTQREFGYVSSASDSSVHSEHMLKEVRSQRHSINKNSDSGGKNSRPQKNKNVVPKVKQAAISDDSYGNQPVLKLRDLGHVTSPDHQIERNSSHVAEHQGSINFSKNKQPIKENIDLDYDVKEEDIAPVMWAVFAEAEHNEALKNKVRDIHTVLCVDTSASMRGGQAWDQATTFVKSFLSGLEEVVNEGIRNRDFVSLSVFGHETKVVQRLTLDLHLLRTSFDNLTLGGPTQMYGGLWMALAGEGAASCPNSNHILIYPRIILISDGKPTSPALRAGPDVYNESDQEQIESEILEVVDSIAEKDIKIHCIPVGTDPNMIFLEKIAAKSKGKMFTYNDGRYLARRSRNTAFAGHVLKHWKIRNERQPLYGGEVSLEDLIFGSERGSVAAKSMPGSAQVAYLSKADKEHVLALAKEALEEGTFTDEDNVMSFHYESTDPSCYLPPLGSRVRRGPDWDKGMQDDARPGTVIGHVRDRKHEVYVEWDRTGKTANYRYGPRGYDVVIVEEPRLLQFDELIGTGCVVQRGKDWKWGNQDGVPGTKGVVIQVLENGQVLVRWPDKSKNVCRYGADGCFDLEICNPFD